MRTTLGGDHTTIPSLPVSSRDFMDTHTHTTQSKIFKLLSLGLKPTVSHVRVLHLNLYVTCWSRIKISTYRWIPREKYPYVCNLPWNVPKTRWTYWREWSGVSQFGLYCHFGLSGYGVLVVFALLGRAVLQAGCRMFNSFPGLFPLAAHSIPLWSRNY